MTPAQTMDPPKNSAGTCARHCYTGGVSRLQWEDSFNLAYELSPAWGRNATCGHGIHRTSCFAYEPVREPRRDPCHGSVPDCDRCPGCPGSSGSGMPYTSMDSMNASIMPCDGLRHYTPCGISVGTTPTIRAYGM